MGHPFFKQLKDEKDETEKMIKEATAIAESYGYKVQDTRKIESALSFLKSQGLFVTQESKSDTERRIHWTEQTSFGGDPDSELYTWEREGVEL